MFGEPLALKFGISPYWIDTVDLPNGLILHVLGYQAFIITLDSSLFKVIYGMLFGQWDSILNE